MKDKPIIVHHSPILDGPRWCHPICKIEVRWSSRMIIWYNMSLSKCTYDICLISLQCVLSKGFSTESQRWSLPRLRWAKRASRFPPHEVHDHLVTQKDVGATLLTYRSSGSLKVLLVSRWYPCNLHSRTKPRKRNFRESTQNTTWNKNKTNIPSCFSTKRHQPWWQFVNIFFPT